MLRFLLTFLFISCAYLPSHGEVVVVDSSKIDNPEVTAMTAKDQWVYLFLKDICRNGSFASFRESLSQSFNAGSQLWSLSSQRLQGYYRRGMTASHIEAVFSSSATPLALEKCFGHMDKVAKAERKDALLFELMFWDYVGNHVGLMAGTVGLSRLFSAIFSALNRFGWQPFKKYVGAKFKMNERQLKWLDRVVAASVITVPVAYHIKQQHDENRQLEEYEVSALNQRIQSLQEVKTMLVQIENQLLNSSDKDFWLSAKANMLDQANRLCREIKETLPQSRSQEFQNLCSPMPAGS